MFISIFVDLSNTFGEDTIRVLGATLNSNRYQTPNWRGSVKIG